VPIFFFGDYIILILCVYAIRKKDLKPKRKNLFDLRFFYLSRGEEKENFKGRELLNQRTLKKEERPVNTTEKKKPLLVVITGRTDKNLIYRIRAKPPIFEHDIFIRREENQREDVPMSKQSIENKEFSSTCFLTSTERRPQQVAEVKVLTSDTCCSFFLIILTR